MAKQKKLKSIKQVIKSVKASKRVKKPKPLSKKVLAKQQGFRSGLELQTAEQLQELNVTYSYETDKITYTVPAHESKYTPDFVFTKKDGSKMYIETKGRFTASDRKKHVLIKTQYPLLDIRILFQAPENKLSKSSKTTYASWCDKYKIKYGKFPIPTEWLEEIL